MPLGDVERVPLGEYEASSATKPNLRYRDPVVGLVSYSVEHLNLRHPDPGVGSIGYSINFAKRMPVGDVRRVPVGDMRIVPSGDVRSVASFTYQPSLSGFR